MNLFETVCAAAMLSLFMISLPDIIIPAAMSAVSLPERQDGVRTAAFLSKSFRIAAEKGDIASWQRDCAPFAGSCTVSIEREKDTAALYKAECTVQDRTFVFYGAVRK